MPVDVTSTPHSVIRLDVHTGIAFDTFRKAFEEAAPPFDQAAMADIVAQGGSWDDVKAAIAAYPQRPDDLHDHRREATDVRRGPPHPTSEPDCSLLTGLVPRPDRSTRLSLIARSSPASSLGRIGRLA